MTEEPNWTYLTLSLDADVLPAWFDVVQRLCAGFVNRMMVIERPEAWIVRIEIAPEKSEAFQSELALAWELFAAQRRALGEWQQVPEA
jgi:hypothetical protein